MNSETAVTSALIEPSHMRLLSQSPFGKADKSRTKAAICDFRLGDCVLVASWEIMSLKQLHRD
jgi:hypothetical protein